MDITQTVERVLQAHSAQLAAAGTADAVQQLSPAIAQEVENTYKPQNDPFAYRAVIVILGVVVVLVALTYARFALTPDLPQNKLRDLPDALIALGSASMGALAGLLAPAPRN